MSLENEILFFDKRVITEQEIKEHVIHYVNKAMKGMSLLDQDNKREAMECLKEIRITLKDEYQYYEKLKVQKVFSESKTYKNYYKFIRDALVKQNSPNKYDNLRSNLFDVWDYGHAHCGRYLNEIKESGDLSAARLPES